MKISPTARRTLTAVTAALALCAPFAGHLAAQTNAPVGAAPQPGVSSAPNMQTQPRAPQAALNVPPLLASDKAQLIAATVLELNKRYVFPDVAKRASEALSAKHKAGAYDAITDGVALANALSDDLFALTKDSHLRYRFEPMSVPMQHLPNQVVSAADAAAARLDAEQRNFGVERVERLPGNIGYVDVRLFYSPAWAGDTLAAAMNLIANTDALIIDVRQNGGGFSETVALLTSYLLNERTHLSSFYLRDDDSTEQSWSLDWLPGKRFGGTKPVYVLTSKRSVSGAEEFAYNLKHLKRATLVGETTVGASNPGAFAKLTPLYSLFIPNGRVTNAVTKTNWEGIGVEPDVKVPADDALRTAQILALKALQAKTTDPRRAMGIGRRVDELEQQKR